jgi:hypothetical protein
MRGSDWGAAETAETAHRVGLSHFHGQRAFSCTMIDVAAHNGNPIEIMAKSNPTKTFPISLNAGQQGQCFHPHRLGRRDTDTLYLQTLTPL